MQQNGMSFALSICQRFNLTGKNADTIGFIINLSNEALQQRGWVLISSPKLFEREIYECPFSNSSHQICPDLLVMRSTGICEAINSDFEIVPKSRMCRGDKTCHWIIKKKTAQI
jgi:hypothetical protein